MWGVKASSRAFSSWLTGVTSTLVCISGPSTGCGALMRGKFVLAKHGQIYEPARLSSSALTTDINIRTLQGDCITWGIGSLPTWSCVRGWFHRDWCILQITVGPCRYHFTVALYGLYRHKSACSVSSTVRTMISSRGVKCNVRQVANKYNFMWHVWLMSNLFIKSNPICWISTKWLSFRDLYMPCMNKENNTKSSLESLFWKTQFNCYCAG